MILIARFAKLLVTNGGGTFLRNQFLGSKTKTSGSTFQKFSDLLLYKKGKLMRYKWSL